MVRRRTHDLLQFYGGNDFTNVLGSVVGRSTEAAFEHQWRDEPGKFLERRLGDRIHEIRYAASRRCLRCKGVADRRPSKAHRSQPESARAFARLKRSDPLEEQRWNGDRGVGDLSSWVSARQT